MHDIAGLVALAVIGLWIAYLVPHRLRYRQQLLESRAEDRFSDALRVLVVADARRRDVRAAEARADCGPDSPKRFGLLSPARGVPVGGRPAVTEGKGGVVERPYGTQDRISADDARRAAQERAQRAASVARRAAAARRRALLTAVLVVASVVAWAVVGLTAATVVAGVVPTVLLAAALVLGRRAVVAGQAADAAWERRQRERTERGGRSAAPRARVTGRAHHPSDNHTEVLAQVGGDAVRVSVQDRSATAPAEAGTADDATRAEDAPAEDAPAEDARADEPPAATDDAHADGSDDARTTTPAASAVDAGPEQGDRAQGAPAEPPSDGWSPVPVPRPTYTTKATAPRREPLPLVVDDPAEAAPAAATSAGDAQDGASEAEGTSAPALDLDAILARRRAAGE